MIGLDTNVVIRYLVQDDPKQASAAVRFIEKTLSAESPGFLSHIVLCEIVWVLEDCYSQSRAQIATILQTLFTARQIIVHRGGDFSDALIGLAGAAAGCTHTVTFDKEAAKLDGFVMVG